MKWIQIYDGIKSNMTENNQQTVLINVSSPVMQSYCDEATSKSQPMTTCYLEEKCHLISYQRPIISAGFMFRTINLQTLPIQVLFRNSETLVRKKTTK